jgi:leucyl/phenylalanyl-tRNA---protein transferase
MLPYLNIDSPFPRVDEALQEPNGLLAAGADLSPARLLSAYANGIFPWYSPGEPILWWSPDPRAVFFIDNFKAHKSVRKTLAKLGLKVTLNQAFNQVISACAAPRSDVNGTWITDKMIAAYSNLHQAGNAHSVEVWQNDILVGGIYGVATGGVFCGESMFSRISNGSKIALSCLAAYLKQLGFRLIDCQIENPHLGKLGSSIVSRRVYLQLLKQTQNHRVEAVAWKSQTLDWKKLLEVETRV